MKRMDGKEERTQAYEIRLHGRLDERWSDWFSGMMVTAQDREDGTPVTTLSGAVDQPALRGILTRIWDLNLTLISVVPIENDPGDRTSAATPVGGM
jgi:hypothetical protein